MSAWVTFAESDPWLVDGEHRFPLTAALIPTGPYDDDFVAAHRAEGVAE